MCTGLGACGGPPTSGSSPGHQHLGVLQGLTSRVQLPFLEHLRVHEPSGDGLAWDLCFPSTPPCAEPTSFPFMSP